MFQHMWLLRFSFSQRCKVLLIVLLCNITTTQIILRFLVHRNNVLVLKFELQRFIIFFIYSDIYKKQVHCMFSLWKNGHLLQYNEKTDAYLTSGSIKCIVKLFRNPFISGKTKSWQKLEIIKMSWTYVTSWPSLKCKYNRFRVRIGLRQYRQGLTDNKNGRIFLRRMRFWFCHNLLGHWKCDAHAEIYKVFHTQVSMHHSYEKQIFYSLWPRLTLFYNMVSQWKHLAFNNIW